MSIYEEAKKWIDNGIAVIPIKFRDKKPDRISWREYQTSLPTEHDLRNWFPGRMHNFAVLTGWKNLVVVDFDNEDLWLKWFNKYQIFTYTVKTRRGAHAYFFIDELPENQSGENIDIQAKNKYVVAAPSTHKSGFVYQAVGDLDSNPIKRIRNLSEVLSNEYIKPIPPRENIDHKPPARVPLIENDIWGALDSEPMDLDLSLTENINKRISILDFLPGAQKSGGNFYLAICPFHDDRDPSFWINETKNICNCHSCKFSKDMDVINFYARLHNISNSQAITELAQMI